MISVLLIENDFNQIWQFKKACSGTEFSLEWSHEPYSAYKKFLTTPFDIVICKIQLPYENGFHILKNLKDKFHKFHSLLLSQNFMGPEILKQLQIDGQIQHPSTPGKILGALRSFKLEPLKVSNRPFVVRTPRISFANEGIPLDIQEWGKTDSLNFKGELLDLSSTGMGFVTPTELQKYFSPQDLISVRPPQMRRDLEICGKVIYSKSCDKSKHIRWGILFRDPISIKDINQELCLYQQFK